MRITFIKIFCGTLVNVNKHFNLTVLFSFLSLANYAQTISPQVINTTGNNISGTQGSLEYAVGEVAIATFSNTTYALSQGFLQSYSMVTATVPSTFTGIASNFGNNAVSVFPNPTQNKVTLIGNDIAKIMIFNYLGVFIKEEYAMNEISLTELPSGIYLLKIYNQDNLLIKTQKITKL